MHCVDLAILRVALVRALAMRRLCEPASTREAGRTYLLGKQCRACEKKDAERLGARGMSQLGCCWTLDACT
jgi:hypothetical protein